MAHDWIKRRAKRARIILITDGEPTDLSPTEILNQVDQGIPVDSIFVASQYEPLFGGRRFLEELSALTGGVFAEVSDVSSLASSIKALSPAERPVLGAPKGGSGGSG